MGNKESSQSLTSLSKEDVASAVAAKGAKYEPYAVKFRENGIDGEFLEALESDEELSEMLDELDISSKVHRKVLTLAYEKAQKQNQQSFNEEGNNEDIPEAQAVVENAAHFRAAEALNLTAESPDDQVEPFDKIAVEIMNHNERSSYAGVNLICSDAQHPIGARIRKPNGTLISDRTMAFVPIQDSVCYYLVHDPSRESLIMDLPEGNPFGSTYVGYVVKDGNDNRVGAVCQVTELRDEQDKNEQIMLLQRLAKVAEEQIEERRALQSRATALRQQVKEMRCSQLEILDTTSVK